MALSSHVKIPQKEENLYLCGYDKALSGRGDQGCRMLEAWVACWDDEERTGTERASLLQDVA